MWPLDFVAQVKREQYHDELRTAERRRLLAAVRAPRISLSRRVARPVGYLLLHLGTALLRYGQTERATRRWEYGPPTDASRLN
jgi:hypothetical protein